MKLWIWKAAYAGEARQPSMQLCRYITLIRYTSTVVRVNPEGTRDCKVIMMRKRKRMGEDTHNKMCYIWYSFSCTVTENSLTNLSRNQVRINLVHMYVCMSVCVRVCRWCCYREVGSWWEQMILVSLRMEKVLRGAFGSTHFTSMSTKSRTCSSNFLLTLHTMLQRYTYTHSGAAKVPKTIKVTF